jgi:hypothetical protein
MGLAFGHSGRPVYFWVARKEAPNREALAVAIKKPRRLTGAKAALNRRIQAISGGPIPLNRRTRQA